MLQGLGLLFCDWKLNLSFIVQMKKFRVFYLNLHCHLYDEYVTIAWTWSNLIFFLVFESRLLTNFVELYVWILAIYIAGSCSIFLHLIVSWSNWLDMRRTTFINFGDLVLGLIVNAIFLYATNLGVYEPGPGIFNLFSKERGVAWLKVDPMCFVFFSSIKLLFL